jgi:hypothetical protein
MALTKRSLEKAARLYALAVVANQDAGVSSSDEEAAVMQRAIDASADSLRRLGFEPGDLSHITDCIRAAIRVD